MMVFEQCSAVGWTRENIIIGPQQT